MYLSMYLFIYLSIRYWPHGDNSARRLSIDTIDTNEADYIINLN
jgi:hypothetical protein